jgi:ABC-type uncharacterized transport system substrate-binding protein
LTLHFTLPFKNPLATRKLDIEIYDPSFFVYFEFSKNVAVKLIGAPVPCKLTVERAKALSVEQTQSLSEEFFNALVASNNWGSQLTNKVGLMCP